MLERSTGSGCLKLVVPETYVEITRGSQRCLKLVVSGTDVFTSEVSRKAYRTYIPPMRLDQSPYAIPVAPRCALTKVPSPSLYRLSAP
ncbi:hypothetical protein RRG08_001618 [Elysia crispata]|uniref:Uncharacterized protein n=1 Tax=Elysia crispata TaxID=231223 RepID=A0AAE1AKC7_9GAST|nr:hypothetical protein RRG08_001618 [Elysia crispata]